MQNPDEPNLPFAQSSNLLSVSSLSRRQPYYDYIVNGDHWTFGKMVNKKVRWTESNAQQYRNKGYSVVKVAGTGDILIPKPPIPTGTTSNGHSHVFETLHPKQTKQLIKIGVDTTKLGVDTTVLGNKLSEAKTERDRIEAKVNANKAEHQDFHDKLQSLGDSLALHSTHSLIPTIPPIIPTSVILVAVGIGAYFLMRRKRK
jgi:FtsZ-binding cell division protein ZapB